MTKRPVLGSWSSSFLPPIKKPPSCTAKSPSCSESAKISRGRARPRRPRSSPCGGGYRSSRTPCKHSASPRAQRSCCRRPPRAAASSVFSRHWSGTCRRRTKAAGPPTTRSLGLAPRRSRRRIWSCSARSRSCASSSSPPRMPAARAAGCGRSSRCSGGRRTACERSCGPRRSMLGAESSAALARLPIARLPSLKSAPPRPLRLCLRRRRRWHRHRRLRQRRARWPLRRRPRLSARRRLSSGGASQSQRPRARRHGRPRRGSGSWRGGRGRPRRERQRSCGSGC
mmetsp:Transcript_113441/g.293773  ORF Transcript_113441/g.293773 Transcript_113441/m.293773 type:complete len:284 (+) Transcript_113441:643-1494(+)